MGAIHHGTQVLTFTQPRHLASLRSVIRIGRYPVSTAVITWHSATVLA